MKSQAGMSTFQIIDDIECHYVRPSFTVFPDSVGEIFLVQPLLKKSTRVLMVFQAGGATMIDNEFRAGWVRE